MMIVFAGGGSLYDEEAIHYNNNELISGYYILPYLVRVGGIHWSYKFRS